MGRFYAVGGSELATGLYGAVGGVWAPCGWGVWGRRTHQAGASGKKFARWRQLVNGGSKDALLQNARVSQLADKTITLKPF